MAYNYHLDKGLITAIVPVYTSRGSMCQVHYEDGSLEEVSNRLTYILKRYLYHWGTVLRSYYQPNRRTFSPLTNAFVVNGMQTFIPLRVLDPICKGDTCKGLFWHERIEYPYTKKASTLTSIECNNKIFRVKTTCYNLHMKCKQADHEHFAYMALYYIQKENIKKHSDRQASARAKHNRIWIENGDRDSYKAGK